MDFNIELITVGKLKQTSPFYALYDDYVRRIKGKVNLIELDGKNRADELKKINEKLFKPSPLILLDERGAGIPSIQFAKKLEELHVNRPSKIQFVIGGADGLDDNIRQKADIIMNFSTMTWPHMMARVMLVEQIYRAQQILANHPYHRE